MRILKDIRLLVIISLIVLVALRVPDNGVSFLAWVVLSIVSACLIDFVINKIFYGKNIIPKSAVITGLIVGGILDFTLAWYWVVLFSCIAILSKHLIKFQKKHIFNPANFGLFCATVLGFTLTWNIESNIYLIIIIGAYWVYKLKKYWHILGFLTAYFLLFLTQGFNPLTLVSWFFLFVMLIEPKTSGAGKIRGLIFGAISGASSFVVFKLLPFVDFFVVSLFIANLSNIILVQLSGRHKEEK